MYISYVQPSYVYINYNINLCLSQPIYVCTYIHRWYRDVSIPDAIQLTCAAYMTGNSLAKGA